MKSTRTLRVSIYRIPQFHCGTKGGEGHPLVCVGRPKTVWPKCHLGVCYLFALPPQAFQTFHPRVHPLYVFDMRLHPCKLSTCGTAAPAPESSFQNDFGGIYSTVHVSRGQAVGC